MAPQTLILRDATSRLLRMRTRPFEQVSGDTLDREARQIGGGIGGIEDLAVEEGFRTARCRSRDVRFDDTQRLRSLAPEILAVHLIDQGLDIGRGLKLAPADVLGDEPGIMALEGIGNAARPELHGEVRSLC